MNAVSGHPYFSFGLALLVLAAAAVGLVALLLGRRKKSHPDGRSAEEIQRSRKNE